MGAQARTVKVRWSSSYLHQLLCNHGPNESNEGDEGCSQGNDGKCGVQRRSGDDRPEGEGREGCHGGHRCGCCGRVEEEWFFQTCGIAELEAQEEASDASQEGSQSIHEGTMRVQGQASVEDRQGTANEEVAGDDQLIRALCSEVVSLISDRGGRTRQVCR